MRRGNQRHRRGNRLIRATAGSVQSWRSTKEDQKGLGVLGVAEMSAGSQIVCWQNAAPMDLETRMSSPSSQSGVVDTAGDPGGRPISGTETDDDEMPLASLLASSVRRNADADADAVHGHGHSTGSGAGPIRRRNPTDSARATSILAMAGAHEHKAAATNKAATARQPRGNRHRRRSVRDPAETQDFFRPQVIFIFPAAICRICRICRTCRISQSRAFLDSMPIFPLFSIQLPRRFVLLFFFEQSSRGFCHFPSTPQHTYSWLSTNSVHVVQMSLPAQPSLPRPQITARVAICARLAPLCRTSTSTLRV